MSLNTIFERNLLKVTLKDVRAELNKRGIEPKVFIKHSWGYKTSFNNTVEFHINKNEYLPEGFYWHGTGSTLTYAKAEGWSNFLQALFTSRINLKGTK